MTRKPPNDSINHANNSSKPSTLNPKYYKPQTTLVPIRVRAHRAPRCIRPFNVREAGGVGMISTKNRFVGHHGNYFMFTISSIISSIIRIIIVFFIKTSIIITLVMFMIVIINIFFTVVKMSLSSFVHHISHHHDGHDHEQHNHRRYHHQQFCHLKHLHHHDGRHHFL